MDGQKLVFFKVGGSRKPFFHRHILDLLSMEKLSLVFPNAFGQPTKGLYTVLNALTLQQYTDLIDEQTIHQLAFDIFSGTMHWITAVQNNQKFRFAL